MWNLGEKEITEQMVVFRLSRGLVPIITPTTAIMIETPYKKNLYIKDGVINNNSPYLLLIILKNYIKKKPCTILWR